MIEGRHRQFRSLRRLDEAQHADRFQPHARVRVLHELGEVLDRLRFATQPVAEDARGRRSQIRIVGTQARSQQFRLDNIESLEHPQGFQPMPGVEGR